MHVVQRRKVDRAGLTDGRLVLGTHNHLLSLRGLATRKRDVHKRERHVARRQRVEE